jgi:hypothetical protein
MENNDNHESPMQPLPDIVSKLLRAGDILLIENHAGWIDFRINGRVVYSEPCIK